MNRAFTPLAAGTKRLAATSTSARIALAKADEPEIEVTNDGPDPVYVEIGGSTVEATAPVAAGAAGSYPVLAGQSKVIRNLRHGTYAAAICGSGKTADVTFTSGEGE